MKKINISKCPNCNAPISYWKIMRHSRFTPIKCPDCSSKLIFCKAEWYKKCLWLIPFIALDACGIAGCKSFALMLSLLAASIAGLIIFFISLGNMKFRIKTKKSNK
jgi:DNA-directed RNA polymerase subunit RPC12/RpoP